MDRYPIRVTLLANAGVLIRYRDTALLLDGLFGRKDNPFSLLPPGCREAMLRGEPPFERLDYLLFTHYHPDHFDPEMVRALLEHRRVKGLFYPKDEAPAVQKLSRWLQQEGIPCVPLCRGTDRAAIQIEPGISVQAFMVPHLGEEYRSVPHVCYLLSFDGGRVKITGQDAGLHFLAELQTSLPDDVLQHRAAEKGLRLAMLSDYYHDKKGVRQHTLVVNYSGLNLQHLPRALEYLADIIKEGS